VLGVSDHLLDAANPVVLLRTIVALGVWYPAILALTAALLARFEQDFPESRFLARAQALQAEHAPLRR
jgi:hypothetical protein